MVRVPGTTSDLLSVKAQGGDVRMVYSPLDALALARRHPDRQVVFFAVGFETTAPATAMAVYRAAQQQIEREDPIQPGRSEAILETLEPGNYTVVVTAPNRAEPVAYTTFTLKPR
jgi:hypothetical protein